ncbi:MAG: hypothetical protein A3B74_04595 [Candidatus Kerfeldbacteria bacterium RIFCSPHIGHO2_02_FULL_42_14]|uniref:Uncharacterized protein n=1 Tax=Candidatus Kerfeldbacteria bacterium RIFCSPHIGHO2_02_FULL_42_14 TaxID=1798540 RepID=A0A1G2ANY4_9BACT|nr:MAG: hypothetical protein A3B74_04595 [Candidatus Kerfeldbacteria bacterium RIFCSPHIGHO2_02_FULL_42_14]OGY81005.1 MAG: hypothetical protein A3E60_03315 [Candidatus Kerfeldbacteria bacterium RIFCSPHIGHO2_12_FULL_42_13]OGY84961.1 MAG: hypothetical protein A3I91_00560 [Candidatus Kerfeldbacteria bacterium RIFCSPLOWO2_02_FULL_42_19]OGY86128.1 MAG: hypothetical protein A3G01_02090 [Candidatus Kerfeldbacteria bacterium RIFCSPLOWO2_12_FULL_43_9]
MGNTVVKKDMTRKSALLYGSFHFTILATHNPSAVAKAPMNIPILNVLIPSHMAPTAVAPAASVQSGQCANTTIGKMKMIVRINDIHHTYVLYDFFLFVVI